MKKEITIDIPEVSSKKRLDSFLNENYPKYSRSYFQRLILEASVTVNGKPVKPSYNTKTGDRVIIQFREIENITEPIGEDIPLNIIYEDDSVLVINKQPGIVVHPAAGNASGTLVNALINYFPEISQAVYDQKKITSKIRPGLIQRLDKDTSGIMIIAKNAQAIHSLARQIQNRYVKKIYWALVLGWPKQEQGRVISFLGRHPKNRKAITNLGPGKGKEAISDYRVLENYYDTKNNKLSLIEFDIKTGRTHQIRVHSKEIGHPVIGDSVYGTKESNRISKQLGVSRQLLHAKELNICLPGNAKPTKFEAPLPEDFQTILSDLHNLGTLS